MSGASIVQFAGWHCFGCTKNVGWSNRDSEAGHCHGISLIGLRRGRGGVTKGHSGVDGALCITGMGVVL